MLNENFVIVGVIIAAIGSFDFICGGLSLVGLMLWYVTKVGNVAIAFSMLADGLAALPTILKSYTYLRQKVVGPI